MANIEDRVEELISKSIQELGYELYDVQYLKEGKDYFLKIFIDKPQGIDLNDCENVNNAINSLLDEADYIKEQYFLEVSSPGIERVLRKNKHFEDNLEKLVEVKMFKAIDGQKVIQGILKRYTQEDITLEINTEEVELDRKNISLIKTVYNW